MTSTDVLLRNTVITVDTVIGNEAAAEVFAYWQAAREGRIAPKRADIDPMELFEHLPNISMIKCIGGAGMDFEFSLIGTGLAKIYGLVTGQRIAAVECWPPLRKALQGALELCALERSPVHGIWPQVLTLKKVEVDIEVVLVPVSEDGSEVSRVLGYHAITA